MKSCSNCGLSMSQGFLLDDEYYCSEPCAVVGDIEAYNDLQENGPSDERYWTIWEEEEDEE